MKVACAGSWITKPAEGGDLEEFLDREQERYRKQLKQYAALMKMLDNRHFSFLPFKGRIREGMGLYFPLLKGWREWVA